MQLGLKTSERLLFRTFCVAALVASSHAAARAEMYADRAGQLYVVAQEDTLLTGDDIESYNRSTGTLVLTPGGYYAWTGNLRPLIVEGEPSQEKTVLSERQFRFIYKGISVLEGTIRSGRSLELMAGIVLWDSDTENNRGRLSLRYLRFLKGMGPDPLESPAFLEYFIDTGKLINWDIDWVVDR